MGGLRLQLVVFVEQCFDGIAKLTLVLTFSVSATTAIVNQFNIAEIVGGFALPCTAVVIGALVATALGAVGKGDLMATFVDLDDFIESAIDQCSPITATDIVAIGIVLVAGIAGLGDGMGTSAIGCVAVVTHIGFVGDIAQKIKRL